MKFDKTEFSEFQLYPRLQYEKKTNVFKPFERTDNNECFILQFWQ